VYRQTFPRGEISFNLIFPSKISSVNFILFYKLDEIAGGDSTSCGGEEIMISLPEGPAYASCASSSENPDGKSSCKFGISGKMEDAPFSIWASDGEGLDSWL